MSVRRPHEDACDLGVDCFCRPSIVVVIEETDDAEYAAWLDAALEADAHPTANVPAALYADRPTVTDGDLSFVSMLLSGSLQVHETVTVEVETVLTRNRS